MIIAKFASVVILGYLLGAIPFGLLISRRSAKVDLRQHGSGKTGATNVLRTAGKKAAALVAILDVSKGVLAVIFAGLIVRGDYLVVGGFGLGILVAQVLAALAAVLGHNFPVFLKFKGGRGVATFYSVLVPLTIFSGFPIEYLVYALIGTIIIVVMHRDNIIRLINGKERKLGKKVKTSGLSPSV